MKVWAYLNSNGVVCCALSKASVPEGISAIELDVSSPDDVIVNNGTITCLLYTSPSPRD